MAGRTHERNDPFAIPYAKEHAALRKWLKSATPEQLAQTLVDAGIVTPDGELAPPYDTEPIISYREPLGDPRTAKKRARRRKTKRAVRER